MNSKDRVITALGRYEPDRVPTFEWEIDENVIQALCPGSGYFDFIEKMDLDAVVVSPNYEIEEIGENLYRDEWGVVRKRGHEAYPIPLEDQAPIKTRQDLQRYMPPPPITSNRFDALRKAVERFKDKIIWVC